MTPRRYAKALVPLQQLLFVVRSICSRYLAYSTTTLKLLSVLFLATANIYKDYFKDVDVFVSLLVISTAITVVMELIDIRSRNRKDRLQKNNALLEANFLEGRNFFRDGIAYNNHQLLEQAIILLYPVANMSVSTPVEAFRSCSAHAAIALAKEKMSYRGATEAIHVELHGDGVRAIRKGSVDYISLSSGKESAESMFFTVPVDMEMWSSAGAHYKKCIEVLKNERAGSDQLTVGSELVSALRNSGYYFSSCYVIFCEDTRELAEAAFSLAVSTCTGMGATERARDLEAKLKILNCINKMPITTKRLCEDARESAKNESRTNR